MTSYSTIWVKCPDCRRHRLIDGQSLQPLLIIHIKEFCKCGKDITEIIKKTYGNYVQFGKITSKIHELTKQLVNSMEIDTELSKLLDLYNEVVIE